MTVSEDCLKALEDIKAPMTNKDQHRLFNIAKELEGASTMIEIGSYRGGSAICLCSGAPEGSKIHCIDTWMNDNTPSYERQDEYENFLENTEKYMTIPHRGESAKIAEKIDLPEESADLLFIDADHSWKGVKTDLYSWIPYLKEGAILIMHDVFSHDGPKKALQTIVSPAIEETILYKANLFAGRVNPQEIMSFFQ